MEQWKDIPGYEGFYQVSDLGNVRSVDHYVNSKCGSTALKRGRIISQKKNIYGYMEVHLSKCGKSSSMKVHRLVTSAFIPNPDNLPYVNHKNEVKTDNRVDNLEWCDSSYNTNYGTGKSRTIQTKIERGLVDPELIGLPEKERKRLWWIKYKKVTI